MSSTVTTVYIDDSNIRLLVMRGKKIKRRATLPLEPGLVEGSVVIKEDETAARLKQFLREKGIKAKKIVAGLSGLHNLTRPIQLPKLPQSLMAEAVLREVKRVLPISMDQFYVMWQAIPPSTTKTDVFVSAIRCRSADSIINTLKKAGLNPVVLDLKPLALTRLVKVRTAIILDVQPTEFDIIIMSDGIPQPIRSMPLPSEARSWPQKLQLIKTELDRTIDFFNANNPEKVLDSGVPIHISGDLTSQPELEAMLPDELGHPVVPLSSRLKSAKDTDYSSYMVNVGLALLDSSLVKRAGPSVANSNLLPQVYRPKPVSLVRLVALPGAATVVALLIPMLILAQSTSANITSLQTQLDTTNRLMKTEQTKKNELKQNLTKAEASSKMFASALEKLNNQHSEVNGNLDIVFDKLPLNVKLTSVDQAKGTLTIRGVAPGDADVLSYASELEKSGRFLEVTVASMKVRENQENENQEIEFTLILRTKG
jgi:Tfp pilus assembly PilM family ATPase/Tfp pilus assembly protein PilN